MGRDGRRFEPGTEGDFGNHRRRPRGDRRVATRTRSPKLREATRESGGSGGAKQASMPRAVRRQGARREKSRSTPCRGLGAKINRQRREERESTQMRSLLECITNTYSSIPIQSSCKLRTGGEVMATYNGEEHRRQRCKSANAQAEAIDASLMMATSRVDCEKLKDLITQKDATTMVVVMTSSNQESKEKSSPATMHPKLASAACRGNLGELKSLLNNRSMVVQRTVDDIEEGMYAASILEGVTMEGDTALHLLAANGHGDNFMDCANLIYGEDKAFLYKQNYNGDTPLHCAARTGNSKMVSHLIDLARGENRVEDLLRKENNSKETALHEAVRVGDNHIVKKLLREDSELARFPEEGPSPLYLAILLEEESIAQTLHDESKHNVLSYAGPKGQNALHAAVMRHTEMVEMLLEWNVNLTSEADCNGSTPLHFLSSRLKAIRVRRTFLSFHVSCGSPWPIRMLLEANPASLFQPDNHGMFPIHVAASVGADRTITRFIEHHPSCAGLRDRRGRTFLHIAAAEEGSRWRTVAFACQTPSLAWILNMQDADGNTALHLAVQAGGLRSFVSLLGNPQVHLNLANKKGQTPLDISRFNTHPGIFFAESTQRVVRRALSLCGARSGSCRQDHFIEAYTKEKWQDSQRKELEKLKDSTQTLCIGSVLIATVAFGATFALPGGYRADDHTNGGTPTLAGSYEFDAFMTANTLAFICSMVSTASLMFSGLPVIDLNSRRVYLILSWAFVLSSIVSLSAAFALGVYMVLAPVAHKTAVAIGVVSPLLGICSHLEFHLKWALLARSLSHRRGLIPALRIISFSMIRLLIPYWPTLFIICWPAIARSH